MIPQYILDFLKDREGFVGHIYHDSLGIATVGMGHRLSKSEIEQWGAAKTIPADVLQAWEQRDAKGAYGAALKQAEELGTMDPEFLKVLASVNFQLGTGWNTLIFKDTWALMLEHRWQEASVHIASSLWAEQTPTRAEDFRDALLSQIPASEGTASATAPEEAPNEA